MITVHMIGNAHLDPVWLWARGPGVDAALATARSACDRLDEYPQFVFTCSGRWFHEVVERLDGELFARIGRFVQAGRWRLVGGMVIQPDCNLPSAESLARQLAFGQDYYRTRFDQATSVGYNVDSFGHAACLPRVLAQAGIDCYTFMRPGSSERPLPGPLFRWRSPDGHEVLAFRISRAYCTHEVDLREHVAATLAALPDGLSETMCFFGVGDHGGGPTRAQIEWIIQNTDRLPNARLVFSHPRAFFDAVAPRRDSLPIVVGELQHHAVGCYSVERRIKTSMRRAEARLLQAEGVAEMLGQRDLAASRLAGPWQQVLFNQFHDIAGGTCVESANEQACGQMIAAEADADDLIVELTRRAFRRHADGHRHRVVAINASDTPFDGYLEHEPYLGGYPLERPQLRDERDRPIEGQLIAPAAKVRNASRLLFPLALPPRSSRVLHVEKLPHLSPPDGPTTDAPSDEPPLAHLENDRVRVDLRRAIALAGWTVGFEVHDDPSDTWAHEVGDRFPHRPIGQFDWLGDWQQVEFGPLREAAIRQARFGCSRLWCRLSLARGESMLRLAVTVIWGQSNQLLRLRLAGSGKISSRTDLVSGGSLARELDAREYPLNGGLIVGGSGGQGTLAVAAPDVFSVSVSPAGVDLLLLRSPYLAHHVPMSLSARPDAPVSDQGRHSFELRLYPNWSAGPGELAVAVGQMLAPPIVFDLTG